MADGLTGNKGGGFFKKALEKFNNAKQTLNEPGTNYERTPLFKKDLEDFQKDLKDLRKEQFDDKMGEEKNKAFQKRMNQEEWNRMLKKGRGIEVPEIETETIDLPEEDENEKEIIVDNDPTQVEDKTIVEDTPLEEPIEEPDVVDPEDYEENRVSAEEVGDDPTIYPTEEELEDIQDENETEDKTVTETPKPEKQEEQPKKLSKEEKAKQAALEEAQAMAQDDLEGFRVPKNWNSWTAKQKADSIKAFMSNKPKTEELKKEPVEEEKVEPMSEEEIMKEAEAIAQHAMPGFRPPENWNELSFDEKTRVVKNWEDANNVEDHSTHNDNSETNNFESYERYPTWLKVAEDVAGAVGKGVDITENVANKDLGGSSINNAVERKSLVPHYDYTSLFGKR